MLIHQFRVPYNLILGFLKPTIAKTPIAFQFRCWPTDTFMLHMNNSCFLQVTELCRWRLYAQMGFFKKYKWVNIMIAENNVKYHKMILPFQSYVVLTTISTSEDKWINYSHRFLEFDPSMYPDRKPPIEYAVIETKAVLKLPNGKSIRPSEFIPWTPFNEAVVKSQ